MNNLQKRAEAIDLVLNKLRAKEANSQKPKSKVKKSNHSGLRNDSEAVDLIKSINSKRVVQDVDDSNYRRVKPVSDERREAERKARIEASNKKRMMTEQERTFEAFRKSDEALKNAQDSLDLFGDIKKFKEKEQARMKKEREQYEVSDVSSSSSTPSAPRKRKNTFGWSH